MKCNNPKCNTTVTGMTKKGDLKRHCSNKCRGQHNSIKSRNKSKETNLERYGVENPMLLQSSKDKIKATNNKKYGVDHAWQSAEIKDKIKATMRERYGVDHQMHSPITKDKIKGTNLERYGVENPMQNSEIKYRNQSKTKETNNKNLGVDYPFQSVEIRAKIKNIIKSKYGVEYVSHINVSAETLLLLENKEWLAKQNETMVLSEIGNKLNVTPTCVGRHMRKLGLKPRTFQTSVFEKSVTQIIATHYTHAILTNDRSLGIELDVYLPDINLAIECNGSYWHSELNGKTSVYHNNKTKICEENGIKLIHIWEHEFNYKNEIVASKLKHLVGATKNRLYARKATIKKVTLKIANELLENWHIQGACVAGHCYALYHENMPCAIMTFSRTRFGSKTEYELIRYATRLNYSVVGGFSRLFKHFVREENPQSIVTFSDRRWSQGNVYQDLFEFSHTIHPGYKYTSNYKDFHSRMAFQKKLIKQKLDFYNDTLTEWQNMQENGYDRIWDCGNDAWVWTATKSQEMK